MEPFKHEQVNPFIPDGANFKIDNYSNITIFPINGQT